MGKVDGAVPSVEPERRFPFLLDNGLLLRLGPARPKTELDIRRQTSAKALGRLQIPVKIGYPSQ